MMWNLHIAFDLRRALTNVFGTLGACTATLRPNIRSLRRWLGQNRQPRQSNHIGQDRRRCYTAYRAKELAPACGSCFFPLFHVPPPFLTGFRGERRSSSRNFGQTARNEHANRRTETAP